MGTLALVLVVVFSVQATAVSQAVVYKNEGCGHCGPYLVELKAALTELGVTNIVEKEFVNDLQVREELARLQESFNVPFTMQGHMVAVVDGKYLFEGHVPVEKVKTFLQSPSSEKMVVYLDSMTGQPEPYSLMNEKGKVKECKAEQQIAECATSGNVVSEGGQTATSGGIPTWVVAALVVLVPLFVIFKFG